MFFAVWIFFCILALKGRKAYFKHHTMIFVHITKILTVEEISGINIKVTTERGGNGGAARTGNCSLKYESTGFHFFF